MNKLRLFILGILFLIPMLLIAQNTVSGTVIEKSTGDPLPGVNVKVQGTDIGTTTDFNGKYNLGEIKDKNLIEFSYVGYKTQIVSATSKTIDITLEEDSETLDQVIIIGYGSTIKKDATGSVALIKAKDLKNEGVTSPEQMLVGKIAGVVVTPSGSPGGGGTIRIRESTSLFAKQDPLVVIDGVPGGSLYDLNNNDIESFSILKDASATAIYGSRGSNGVILVTTKKGRAGELKFEYNNSFTFKSLINKVDVLSADEYRSFVNANGTTDQIALLGNANTDWQDEIFDTGKGMNHDFSMSGGSSSINFRLGIGFATEDGILKTSNFEKGTYSLNLGSRLFKNKLRINSSYRFTQRRHRNADDGAIISAIRFDPTQPTHTNNQTYGGYYQWLANDGFRANGAPANPLSILEQKHDIFSSNYGIGNIKFDYELPYVKGLHANLVLGIDHSSGNGLITTDSNSWGTVLPTLDNYGYKETFESESNNKLLDFYLNYKKDFESLNGNLDFTAGYSYQDFRNSSIKRKNLQNNPNIIPDDPEINKSPLNLQSFFSRLNFNLRGKYLFTASFRRDGTSRFYDSSETWINAPSAAFAWRISDEDFMSKYGTISNLKLRLGWGIVGQQDIPVSFPGLPTYTNGTQTAQYQLGNQYYTTSRAEPYNPLLKWESTTTYNLGIDYGILNNKIDGSIELFHRKSKDLLNKLPFPAGSSLSNEDWANIGNLKNNGIEFTINTKLIDQDDLKLNTSLNATYNTLEITKLTASNDDTYIGLEVNGYTGGVGNTAQIHTVGYAPNSFYVYQQVYDTNGKPVEGVYVDRNGDGQIDSDDKYRFKRPNSDVTLGLNTNLDYKNFDFNMFWRASIGNFVYNNIDSNLGFEYQMLNTSNTDVINNGTRNVLETGFQNGGTNRYLSDYYIQDASFLKLDNLTLGYTLDKYIKKSNVRIYASVQNVLTLTKYTGTDPETVYNDADSGIDYNTYPRPRSFVFGMNVKF